MPLQCLREVEIKFHTAGPAVLEKLPQMLADLGLEASAPIRQSICDTYIDTDDWQLYYAGTACRLRRTNEETTLELKELAAPREGIAIRLEMAEPIADTPSFVRGALPGFILQKLLARLIPHMCVARRFQIEQERSMYTARAATGLALHASADIYRINDGPEEFAIELETTQGTPEQLQAIADEFAAKCGLEPAHVSKFRRGLKAAGFTPRNQPPKDNLLDRLREQLAHS